MAKYRFNARLTKDSIDNLIQDIKNYQNTLEHKVDFFQKRLAEYGIQVAKMNLGILDDVGNTSYLIGFRTTTENGVTIIHAFDKQKVINTWVNEFGLQSAEISPLLMAEFGSGWNAHDIYGVGLGQGTFPGQTHAFDKPGWHWKDENGEWHYSNGIIPQMPIFKACMQMQSDYKRIAREVFG